MLCLAALAPTASLAEDDAEWGSVRGQFVYDGPLPEVKRLPLAGVQKEEFGDTLPDESLLVNKENKGVANVFVYLLPDADKELRVHPSYDESAEEKVELAMQGGRYVPHVLLVRTTQTVALRNKDKVVQMAQFYLLGKDPIHHFLPAEEVSQQRFAEEKSLPAYFSNPCAPWMTGWVLVRTNPYMTVSDENGRFEIEKLPVGKHTFQLWHERIGWLREIQIGMHKTDERGRLTVTIEPGEYDLHFAELAPELFEPDR
jgi:hypothetical protein